MRKKLVAGNWKMHGSLQQNAGLLERIRCEAANLGCEVAVCAPYPYLAQAQALLGGSSVAWGAQSVSEHAAGAFTGEVPILCVGESLAEREAGATAAVVSRQLAAVLDRVGVLAMRSAVVAYEPVWAIGSGLTATPQQAQEVHAAIRAQVANVDASVANGLRILYGGSVKPQNASELFVQPDIDGGLIGGAALVADDFLAICRAAG